MNEMECCRTTTVQNLYGSLVAAVVMTVLIVPALADSRGMVMDDVTHRAVVFDVETDTVLGSVAIPQGLATGDCAITSDQKLGLATNFNHQVWVVNLSSVSLASGANPIPISNFGEDVSISPDGRYAVVCDGSAVEPVSVIDISSRTEHSTFQLPGSDCNSVEICRDNSVLVTSVNNSNLRRLTLSNTGTLLDTGDSLSLPSPNNVFCASDSMSGVAVSISPPTAVQSFRIPGLSAVNSRSLPGSALSGVVFVPIAVLPPGTNGNRVAVRSVFPGRVDIFGYDSTTGALSASPLLTIPVADTLTFYGMDQMAVHPSGAKLYVPQPGALNVYDPSTGILLKSITDPAIVGPTGVCLPSCTPPVLTGASAAPSTLWPPNHKMVEVTVDYTQESSCPATCTLTISSNEPGNGKTSPEWQVLDSNHVLLRAERAGNSTGRIYTITITCTNSAGQSSSKTVTVTVAHDQGH